MHRLRSAPLPGLIGRSPAMERIFRLIENLEHSEATVLLTGESGTGKEVVAKLIHARSPRRFRPFVVVECAALQESLLQSELFGHERGAFTGADRAKPGLFEVAHGGTIFLDEIGEISQATQVKLLRVLDTSTFRHVGGTAEIKVDVRVVAATNRDLESMVRQGAFREDLYYRLNVCEIGIPPLRDRKEEIVPLFFFFLKQFSEAMHKKVEIVRTEALKILEDYSWPGNIRELRNLIQKAVLFSEGGMIESRDLQPYLAERTAFAPEGQCRIENFVLPDKPFSLESFTEEIVAKTREKYVEAYERLRPAPLLKAAGSCLEWIPGR